MLSLHVADLCSIPVLLIIPKEPPGVTTEQKAKSDPIAKSKETFKKSNGGKEMKRNIQITEIELSVQNWILTHMGG